MEVQNIQLVNSDQSTTVVQLFDGSTSSDLPVIIILPAMGMKAKYYSGLAQALADAGFQSITSDLRGIGESGIRPEKGTDYGYHEMIEQDIASVVHMAREKYPSRKILFLGHSLGGQLACLYASKYTANVDGLILVACCSVYFGGWEGLAKYRILMGTQFIGLVATAVGYFPGRRIGFGGTNAKGVMQDWSRQSRTGEYRINNDDFDYESALADLNIPILTLSFEGDNYAPLSAIKHLTSKFSSAEEIKNIHLGKDDPLNERFNHFNWPKKPANIVRLISEWDGISSDT